MKKILIVGNRTRSYLKTEELVIITEYQEEAIKLAQDDNVRVIIVDFDFGDPASNWALIKKLRPPKEKVFVILTDCKFDIICKPSNLSEVLYRKFGWFVKIKPPPEPFIVQPANLSQLTTQ